MGTRSLINVHKSTITSPTLTTIYCQFDGYPDGVGKNIYDILKGSYLVNGFGGKAQNQHNGMGCLAATLVKNLKKEIGGVYLYPPGTTDYGENYIYTLFSEGSVICLKCESISLQRKVLFQGQLNEFGNWLKEYIKKQYEDMYE